MFQISDAWWTKFALKSYVNFCGKFSDETGWKIKLSSERTHSDDVWTRVDVKC